MSTPDYSRAARGVRLAVMLAVAAALSACATGPNQKDPYEKFNRAMFSFNDAIDQAALKPVATAYQTVLPTFVQSGVANFFGNLADVWSAANNLLQGKGAKGMSDVTRVAMNSTFGLGGLIDVASAAGLQKHNEDFGQTLGSWGVNSGPYLMLPLLGASTVRDTVALPLDWTGDPWAYKRPVRWRNVGSGVRIIDQRAALLDASNLMEEAALDRYEFVRDSFLQRRESRIDDGDGPRKGDKPAEPKAGKGSDAAEMTPPASESKLAMSSETPAQELTPEAVSAKARAVQSEK